MKNKFYFFVLLLLNLLFFQKVYSSEQFNFDVTEIEILKEGNLIKGLKGELFQQITVSLLKQRSLYMTKS